MLKIKWRLYVFYSKYHILDSKIYPVMMWIQIHARGVQIFFKPVRSECSQIRYYQPKNQQFEVVFSTIVKKNCHISHQYNPD